MEETLKMMKSIIIGGLEQITEKELIIQYKETKNPSVLAYFYVQHFGAIKTIANNYMLLSSEDKASFCLQELDKALLNFNTENNNQFLSYFYICYKNRLRTELESEMTYKRRIQYVAGEYDEEYQGNTNEISLQDEDYILSQYNLTTDEKRQCRLLNMGYNFKEIAKILGFTPLTISIRTQKIRQKILNAI